MAKNTITTELVHSNGTSCVFTFTNMGGYIAATVEASLAPRTARLHLSACDMFYTLRRIEEDAKWGIAEIDEAVEDLAFEMRHLLEFAQAI